MIADGSASNYNCQMAANGHPKECTGRKGNTRFPVFLIRIVLLTLQENQFRRTGTACSRSLFSIADTTVRYVWRDEY
jgi:hypothetical protein